MRAKQIFVQLCFLSFCLNLAINLGGQGSTKNQGEVAQPQSQAPFFLHEYHMKQLGLDCDACHVPEKTGGVLFQRPGHAQCAPCHQDDFEKDIKPKICAQCHSAFPPSSSADLLPFPRYKSLRPIVFEFSHAKHVDPNGRLDSRTGFRADCTFCHHFQADGAYASFGDHVVCAGCHSKDGMKPLLSEKSSTADCRKCHDPEGIENPEAAGVHRELASSVISGKYNQIKFSHSVHFKSRQGYHLDCTTCHYDVAGSTSLADLALPKMADCVECHDVSKAIASQYRMANCQVCHTDARSGPLPAIHSIIVKPVSHTGAFRTQHADEASKPGAACFVCHMNVTPTAAGKLECAECHQVMMPVSHTARWKDDVHGKYAALDRSTCAMCHMTDFCSRCHNQLPRSHLPLAQFKAGGHATTAMLDERSCFTCHTFVDTCAECHSRNLK
jgi:hypothetical protein